MDPMFIGVDLGGTNLRTALIARDGVILEKHKEPSRVSDGHGMVLQRLIESIRRQRDFCARNGHDLAAIGVGAPGVINIAQGIVVTSPNFPDWNDLPLKDELERELRVPVFIENDANAAALGEQWRGAGKGIGSMILLTLGTGVGGGIVLEGSIWHGADGMAGEIGHMTILPEGRTCGCGNTGCLEMYASARGIIQNFRDALTRDRKPSPLSLTSQTVFEAAQRGDAAAARAMQEMGRFLGIGIANLVNIFNPEMVVIGGGVREAWPLFIEVTRAEVRKRAFAVPARRVRIVPSELGDDAGMVGAAAVALQKMGRTLS